MEMLDGGVRLRFPAELRDRAISGQLTMLCTNDAAGDRTLAIHSTDGNFTSPPLNARPGLYHAQLEWTVDGLNYYTQQKLVVP